MPIKPDGNSDRDLSGEFKVNPTPRVVVCRMCGEVNESINIEDDKCRRCRPRTVRRSILPDRVDEDAFRRSERD